MLIAREPEAPLIRDQIGEGSVFRDVRPPHGLWRVNGEIFGSYELISIERPSRSRFHAPEKLLDPRFYAPVPLSVTSQPD